MRSGLRSPCAAPVRLSTSSSIRRCAAKPTISRSKSASELFSSSVRRLIISSLIVGSSVSVEGLATKPYRRSAMTTAMDKWPAAARLVAVAAAGHLPTAPTPPQGARPWVSMVWGYDTSQEHIPEWFCENGLATPELRQNCLDHNMKATVTYTSRPGWTNDHGQPCREYTTRPQGSVVLEYGVAC